MALDSYLDYSLFQKGLIRREIKTYLMENSFYAKHSMLRNFMINELVSKTHKNEKKFIKVKFFVINGLCGA